MPYIKSADYSRAANLPLTPGELNYAITLVAISHLDRRLTTPTFRAQTMTLCHAYITRKGLSYTVGNEVLGVLACAGLEIIRRCGKDNVVMALISLLEEVGDHIYDDLLAPYEDLKIIENGDVYPERLVG